VQALTTRPLHLLCCLLLAGCATAPAIDTRYSALSQDSRVQFIVLHYTEGDFAASLDTLTRGKVSSHYLVDRDPPVIYRLVDDGDGGAGGVNFAPYPQAQIDAVVALVRDIAARHGFDVPQSGELDAATRAVLSRFQMKYRPSNFDGAPDAGTAALLAVVTSPGGLLIVTSDGARRRYDP
jgi:N-acetyl-anhydromuramyl-L-alanine amidase AmpD